MNKLIVATCLILNIIIVVVFFAKIKYYEKALTDVVNGYSRLVMFNSVIVNHLKDEK